MELRIKRCTRTFFLSRNYNWSIAHTNPHICTKHQMIMDILAIFTLLTLQTTFKTIFKKALKASWKRLKLLAAFAVSRVTHWLKSQGSIEDQGDKAG